MIGRSFWPMGIEQRGYGSWWGDRRSLFLNRPAADVSGYRHHGLVAHATSTRYAPPYASLGFPLDHPGRRSRGAAPAFAGDGAAADAYGRGGARGEVQRVVDGGGVRVRPARVSR